MGIMRNEDFSRPPRRNKSWLKKKELDFIKKMSGEVVLVMYGYGWYGDLYRRPSWHSQ